MIEINKKKIRESHSIKNLLKGMFFLTELKKSSIAEEKELVEDRPPSKNLYPSSSKRGARLLAPPLDSPDSLLAPNHQNPGTELDFSNSTKVACLVY